jgi:hypothetical protein
MRLRGNAALVSTTNVQQRIKPSLIVLICFKYAVEGQVKKTEANKIKARVFLR